MGSSSIGGILLSQTKPKYNLNSKKMINKIEKYCDVTVIKPDKKMFQDII